MKCCEYCEGEELGHVSIDNFTAARQVVQYLLSLGHEQIGFVGSVNRFISSEQRQKGYESAFRSGNFRRLKIHCLCR